MSTISNNKPASEQIDDIIKTYGGWKGPMLAKLRVIVTTADPAIVEEVKWKMATRPEGLPVWSKNGIVCMTETWKDNIKLIFPKGVYLQDPNKLFNARLKSKTDRAIEFRQSDIINEEALKQLVTEASQYNQQK